MFSSHVDAEEDFDLDDNLDEDLLVFAVTFCTHIDIKIMYRQKRTLTGMNNFIIIFRYFYVKFN